MKAHNFKDLKGQRFGKLQCISFASTVNRKAMWDCVCDCGTTKVVVGASLVSGKTITCGCGFAERNKARATHGKASTSERHPIYRAFHHARSRCTIPTDHDYKWYGALGVQFKFMDFPSFWNEVAPTWAVGLTLDRIDPFGNYEVGNLRWVSRAVQSRNQRRHAGKSFQHHGVVDISKQLT